MVRKTTLAALAAAALSAAAAPSHWNGGRNVPVHKIALLDANGDTVSPCDSKATPMSTVRTCAQCHDLDAMKGGSHFRTGLDKEDAKPSVPLDLGHHRAERIAVGLKQQAVLRILAAQIDEHAALDRMDRLIAHLPEELKQMCLGVGSIASRTVNAEQLDRLLHGIIGVLLGIVHGIHSFISDKYNIAQTGKNNNCISDSVSPGGNFFRLSQTIEKN